MRYGISASAIVMEGNRILLVRHQFEDGEDFWVTPGGSVEGSETILDCAVRETFEETNLRVDPVKIAYIQDFVEGDYRFCKFHILCRGVSGEPSIVNVPEQHVTDARFVARSEAEKLKVYPEIVSNQLWIDARDGFATTRYLGLTRI